MWLLQPSTDAHSVLVSSRTGPEHAEAISASEGRRIMQRIASGDRIEFERFVRVFAPFVLARAARFSRHHPAAEDIAQVVLANVWRRADSFDAERGNLMAWLQVLTRNAAIDHLRVETRHERNSETMLRQVPDKPPEVGDIVGRRNDSARVRSAVAKLGPDQRIAIELAYFEGLTYVEVANRLGQPEGTVKSRIRRGLVQLGRIVGESNE